MSNVVNFNVSNFKSFQKPSLIFFDEIHSPSPSAASRPWLSFAEAPLSSSPKSIHTRTSASGISKTSPSSAPSTLSLLSCSEKSNASSLPIPRSEGEILSSPNLKAFTFNDLKNATKNFCPDSLLGEWGFGYVYKGWIDEHTFQTAKPGSIMVVAVKRLKLEGLSFQGHKEWLTEVNYLGQLHHINLVKWIGYYLEGENLL